MKIRTFLRRTAMTLAELEVELSDLTTGAVRPESLTYYLGKQVNHPSPTRQRVIDGPRRNPLACASGSSESHSSRPMSQAGLLDMGDPVGPWHSLALDGSFSPGLHRPGRRSRPGPGPAGMPC